MVVKRATKAVLAVNTGIAENGSPSNDMLAAELDQMVQRNSSTKSTLSRIFAKTGDKNACKEAVAQFVPFERNVGK